MMGSVGQYVLLEHLYDGRFTNVYRAQARPDGTPVVLKVLKPWANPDRIHHEYSILKGLDVKGIVRAYELLEQGREVTLVLEDCGGEPLNMHLARGPMALSEVLRIGAALADILAQIHQRRIIHKDVNPTNIILDAEGNVRVLDFDIATRLPREVQSTATQKILAGTLPYISPEQTGRMNRVVDYRTDLYSLGATLYQMLTGSVVFPVLDPIELIHYHVAKTPVRPDERDPSIPGVVSNIVMKLLEKTAEARYQSAFGLKADLEACREQLERMGRIEPFPLGQEDIFDRFQIPQKLYGRGEEIATLERAFARALQNEPELVLVTGSSGIGKSSIIHEIHRSLTRSRGYFISGKFEESKRNLPYSALSQALDELVRSLLAEPEEQLAVFRQRILDAVGSAGQVLTDVLPDLKHIIGAQPPAAELPPARASARFRLLFENFIHVFTRYEQPLVLFLDDLQWADNATLDLLPTLLGNPNGGALLVIGAYRDNEVFPGHPLLSSLAAIEKAKGPSLRIALGPIGLKDTRQLVADALLLGEAEEARPLAELVWRRTGGNPFFAGELLAMLHKSGLIEFDPEHRRFIFDLPRIEREPGTDNVGQIMAARAAVLGARAQEVLKLGAVLGSRFDLDTLSLVAERSRSETATAIEEALQEGLILAVEQPLRRVYCFLHDRVQQTVYASLPRETTMAVHLRIGQILLRSRPGSESHDWRSTVLHHLNLVHERVEVVEERLNLARLNLDAAKAARASGAFAAATGYYVAGILFLPKDAWTSHHELMFEMHFGRAECEYLSGDHPAAEQLFTLLLWEAGTDVERVLVYELMASHQFQIANFNNSIDMALKAISLLGVKVEPHPTKPRVIAEFFLTQRMLGGRGPNDLLNVPQSGDQRIVTIFRVLYYVITASLLARKNLSVTISALIVRLSLEHGYSPHVVMGYCVYGYVLGAVFGDYAQGDAFGQLALSLCERHPDRGLAARLKAIYGPLVCPSRNHGREQIRYGLEAQKDGFLAGNVDCVATGAYHVAYAHVFTGSPLALCQDVCEQMIDVTRRVRSPYIEHHCLVLRQMTLALRGLTKSPESFETEDFSEDSYIARAATFSESSGWTFYCLLKTMTLYLLGFHKEAMAISAGLREDADKSFISHMVRANYYYHDSLLLTSLAGDKGLVARQRDIFTVRGHLRKLKTWAENAPMNFRHKYLLVSAEVARLLKDDHAAIGQYEEAIALARENDYVHEEATALEVTSRFYRSRGVHDVAVSYLARARQVYERWGASGKVALLDRAYPGLAARGEGEGRVKTGLTRTTTNDTSSSSVDVPSMIKASQALSGEISLDKLLLRLMRIVAENAGAERGALIRSQHGTLAIVADFTMTDGARLAAPPTPLTEKSTSVSLGVVTYVLRTQQRVILNDATTDGSFTTDPYVVRRKPKAVLCSPLLQKGEVMGVIYLENNLMSGAFTEERAELLGVLCAQLAISIENAELYSDLEQKVIARTRALKEAQARLIQLEREVTETQMAGGFAHEMRNVLAGADLMLSQVISAKAEPPSTLCVASGEKLMKLIGEVKDNVQPPVRDRVFSIARDLNKDLGRLDRVLLSMNGALRRGLRITGLILDYGQIGTAAPGCLDIDLTALLNRVLEALKDSFAANGISVSAELPPGCVLKGNEDHFQIILENLITNARDALLDVPEGAERALQIQGFDEPARFVLSVRDTGVGIPPELHEKIFEPFFSTKQGTSTGLGLGMVRKLAGRYGGVVEFESDGVHGATFRVVLPKQRALALATAGDQRTAPF
jgi:histidine kinase